MDRKFLLAVAATFIVTVALGFFIHGFILYAHYEGLPAVYRGAHLPASLMALMLAGQLIFSLAFVALYRFGIEGKPWLGQGVRFGVLVAGLAVVPFFLIAYVVTNITGVLAFWQIVLETISVVLIGVMVAWIYRARA